MTGFMKTVLIIDGKSPKCTLIVSQLLKAASKPCKRGKNLREESNKREIRLEEKETDICFNYCIVHFGDSL